jgi:hypothetical protein
LPLLTGAHQDGKPFLHILLAIPDAAGFRKVDASSVNGLSPLGGIHAEYFPLSHTALITYLCVVPEMRRRGISELLLGQIVSVLRKNAAGASIPIFAEAEDPAKLPDSASQPTAYRRLSILSRLGFREIPIKYRQPALGPGKNPVDYLKFLVFSPRSQDTVKSSTVRAFMHEFYKGLDAGEPDDARTFAGLTADDIPTVALEGHT